jgi:hypothetical protein
VSVVVAHESLNGGLAGLARRLKALRGATASAGYDDQVHPETVDDPEGPRTVAEIAMRNNFGIDAPERPFMDISMREGRDILSKYARVAVKKMLDKPSVAAMAPLALAMARSIVDTIDSQVPPPNAAATVAKKGFDHPLIESGYMRANTKAWAKVRGSEKLVEG